MQMHATSVIHSIIIAHDYVTATGRYIYVIAAEINMCADIINNGRFIDEYIHT